MHFWSLMSLAALPLAAAQMDEREAQRHVEESNLDFDSTVRQVEGRSGGSTISAAARTARQQAVRVDRAAVEAVLRAYPTRQAFEAATAPWITRNNRRQVEMRQGKETGQWFGDSFFAPDYLRSARHDTARFAASIIAIKAYLDKLGVDLIVLRAPGRGEVALKYFGGEPPVPMGWDYDHLQLSKQLLEHDVEYLDGLGPLWRDSLQYPLCYWYMTGDGHPAEGYARIIAAELAKRLARYALPRTGEYRLEATGNLYRQEKYPAGNPKFSGSITAMGVRDAAGKVPAIVEKKSSPLLFTSDSYGAYPGVRVGASVPHYVAQLTGHAGDWMYRDGASSSMPPEMLDKGDAFFRGRQVVVMLCHPGNTTFFSTMPDAPLRALKPTAPLVTFDAANWKTLSGNPEIGAPAFAIRDDGMLEIAPLKADAAVGNGGTLSIPLTPEMKKFKALQVTFLFKSHYHFYLSLDAGAGENFRELPKGSPLKVMMPVWVSPGNSTLTVAFPRVFRHKVMPPVLKSIAISGLE